MDWITTSTLLQDLRDHERAPTWERFVARFRPPITRFAVSCGLDATDAEDVAQETLASFLEAYGSGAYDRRQGRLGKWLFGIAYNHVRRARRHHARAANGAAELNAVPAEPDATTAWDHEWEETVLEQCLAQARRETQPTTFRAFELVVVNECTAAEAATVLGVPVRTVYNAKHRVLRRIRELREEIDVAPEKDGMSE